MFDIEISSTRYLFSGPVYVSAFVTVFVSCYHRHYISMMWQLQVFSGKLYPKLYPKYKWYPVDDMEYTSVYITSD